MDYRLGNGQWQTRIDARRRFVRHAILPARFGLRRRHIVSLGNERLSLMNAIACGIVKLSRIPVADNISAERC